MASSGRGGRGASSSDPEGETGADPDRWLVLSVRAPEPGEEPLVADGFLRLGARALDKEGERLVAYVPPPPDPAAFLTEAEEVLLACTTLDDLWFSWRWQHRSFQAEPRLPERRVTDRIVVASLGAEPDAGQGDVVVRIEPGVSFGDAGHGSTRGCLRLLDAFVRSGERVLDVGAGSGILSVAAVLLGAGEVVALERDPLACRIARQNAEANGVAGRVEVYRAEVREGDWPRSAAGPFDGIVANLETDLLGSLLSDLRGALDPAGWLVLSGISTRERGDLRTRARRAGFALALEATEDGWWTGGFRRSPESGGEPGQGWQR